MTQWLQDKFGLIYAPVFIPLIRIAWIILIGFVVLKLIDSGLQRLRLIFPATGGTGLARVEQRTKTLRHIIRSISKGTLIVVIALTISSELGFDIGPILASAGIAGLAVGFGAQSIVKDVISGFFILFEDQFGVGDIVQIGNLSGVVERMTLRSTVLRNLEGQVHVIPNGNIQTVSVLTKEWARAVVDVTVAHSADIAEVFGVLKKISLRLAQDLPDQVLEPPMILGVEKLDETGVTIRLIVKTPPFKQFDVMREWRRRIKVEFDSAGIPLAQAGILTLAGNELSKAQEAQKV
jgi:small-conductance mechanosensitive channel